MSIDVNLDKIVTSSRFNVDGFEDVDGVVEPVVSLREVALAQVGRAAPRRQLEAQLPHPRHERARLLLERHASYRQTLERLVVRCYCNQKNIALLM